MSMFKESNNSGRKLVEINVCVQSRVSLGIGLLTPIAASEESRARELGGNVQFTAATASSTFTVGTDYRSMQCGAAHLSCGAAALPRKTGLIRTGRVGGIEEGRRMCPDSPG